MFCFALKTLAQSAKRYGRKVFEPLPYNTSGDAMEAFDTGFLRSTENDTVLILNEFSVLLLNFNGKSLRDLF